MKLTLTCVHGMDRCLLPITQFIQNIRSICNSKQLVCVGLIASALILLQACSGAGPGNQTGKIPTDSTSVGRTQFEAQCADCHGNDGAGSEIYTGLKRNLTLEELEFIISVAMPPTNPDACVNDCAQDVAKYVHTHFTNTETRVVGDPSTGKSLYMAGCAGCHSEDGTGVGSIPGVTRDLTIEDLTTIIETRMPPLNPDACVDDCATLTAQYIYGNFSIPSDTPPSAPPEVSNGATLYTNMCSECHGLDGLGVGVVIGLTRDIDLAQLTHIITDTMPIIDPSQCTGTCAAQTAQYIYNSFRIPNTNPLPPAPNGETVFVQVCASCHGLDGRGVLTIPGVTRNMSLSQLSTIISNTMPPVNPTSCVNSCADDVAQYIFDNFTLPEAPPAVPPPVSSSGETLYSTQGCAGCHGINGQGIGVVIGVTRNMPLASLTDIIELTMPPNDPDLCTGNCADAIADYIFQNFTDPNPNDISNNPVGNLPAGQVQTNIACERMAQSGDNNRVRDLFCEATPPTINSLRELQAGLGIAFTNTNATGRRNNGRRGNPNFAITGHSSSLVAKFVNAINPRAVIFSRPGRGFIAMGFARGDQFVELITSDRTNNRLSFFLVAFERGCNATNTCTNADILTPAVESNWTRVTLFGEEDLKNTIIDCRQCHQVNGPGTQKILRMQELRDPWNHWFRDNRIGGIALLADFQAAHGTNEVFAGIPPRIISASDPEELEDFVVDNGFRNQPNIFNSGRIQNEVNRTPGQPENNDIPGTSATWNAIYERSKQDLAIPPPYHDIKVTDSGKLATLTQAYQDFRSGVLPAAQFPDLRDAFLQSNLFEIGFAVEPGLDAPGILLQACSQCHNSRLDQTISRARFNVNLDEMSDTLGGILSGNARDQEIGVAIQRVKLPRENIKIMPPAHSFRDLKADEIALVVSYLCSQVTSAITQCP